MRRARQVGFTLVTAIFLLVVVAGLMVYMTNIRVVQQTTLVYTVQGARGLQAAQAGIEWGAYEALVSTPGCPPTTDFVVETFNVNVTCAVTTHREGTSDVATYRLVSTASSGVFGSLDHVQRRVQATVSEDPP